MKSPTSPSASSIEIPIRPAKPRTLSMTARGEIVKGVVARSEPRDEPVRPRRPQEFPPRRDASRNTILAHNRLRGLLVIFPRHPAREPRAAARARTSARRWRIPSFSVSRATSASRSARRTSTLLMRRARLRWSIFRKTSGSLIFNAIGYLTSGTMVPSIRFPHKRGIVASRPQIEHPVRHQFPLLHVADGDQDAVAGGVDLA